MTEKPKDKWLEGLFNKQVRWSKQFEQTMALYNMDVVQNKATKSNEKLLSMVEYFLDDKRKPKTESKPTQQKMVDLPVQPHL